MRLKETSGRGYLRIVLEDSSKSFGIVTKANLLDTGCFLPDTQVDFVAAMTLILLLFPLLTVSSMFLLDCAICEE